MCTSQTRRTSDSFQSIGLLVNTLATQCLRRRRRASITNNFTAHYSESCRQTSNSIIYKTMSMSVNSTGQLSIPVYSLRPLSLALHSTDRNYLDLVLTSTFSDLTSSQIVIFLISPLCTTHPSNRLKKHPTGARQSLTRCPPTSISYWPPIVSISSPHFRCLSTPSALLCTVKLTATLSRTMAYSRCNSAPKCCSATRNVGRCVSPPVLRCSILRPPFSCQMHTATISCRFRFTVSAF